MYRGNLKEHNAVNLTKEMVLNKAAWKNNSCSLPSKFWDS